MVFAEKRLPAVNPEPPTHIQPLTSLIESAAAVDFMGTLTVAEVANILRITPDKCYELIHMGDIPHLKLGRQFRVSTFALWAFLAGLNGVELVEEVMDRFVQQHCCRTDACGDLWIDPYRTDQEPGLTRRKSQRSMPGTRVGKRMEPCSRS